MLFRHQALHVEQLELVRPDDSADGAPRFYKAILDNDVWRKPGELITRRAVTFERIMGTIGLYMDYELSRPVQRADEIWVSQRPGDPDKPVLTADYLNECIEQDSRPAVRIARSQEYPGMIVAHRQQAIGSYAVNWISTVPGVENARLIAAYPHTSGIAGMYDEHTLVAAFIRPDASSHRVQRQMRSTLTT